MAKKKTTKKKEQAAEELYPNQPVVEVVCEIRFPGELAIECRRDEFQNVVRKDYPNLFVPSLKQGQVVALEPYRLTSDESQTSGIMISLNRFSLFEKQYLGHAKFQREFLRLTKVLLGIVNLDKLNRFGLRYINVVPFARENGLIPLERLLKLGISVPEGVSRDFSNLALTFASKAGGGLLTTRLNPAVHPETKQEVFVLDFDFALTENLRFSKLSSYLNAAHKSIHDKFQALITDGYRQFLRGETV